MITATFGKPGKTLLLGLTGENVTRLIAGEPIMVPAARMKILGLPLIKVFIMYGKTEQEIIRTFKDYGIEPEIRKFTE